MNLITKQWIPVRLKDGSRATIAPWEMAKPEVMFPDWPRADFNLACLELLIGLHYLADPPRSNRDWRDRQADPEALEAALAPLAPAFNLTGKGPRFLQDFEILTGETTSDLDQIFIDSSSVNSHKLNKDIVVHRDRYREGSIDWHLAAMAIYTYQIYARNKSPHHTSSLRVSGPLTVLICPDDAPLWQIVWLNTPEGNPIVETALIELPWMKPDIDPTKKIDVFPPEGRRFPPSEVFFPQPRRVGLEFCKGKLKYAKVATQGRQYLGWEHPLTPYKVEPDKPNKAVGAAKGHFSYDIWSGVLFNNKQVNRPKRISDYENNFQKNPNILLGGWVAEHGESKLHDFLFDKRQSWSLDDDNQRSVQRLIEGGVETANLLKTSLIRTLESAPKKQKDLDNKLKKYALLERIQILFYQTSEPDLVKLISSIANNTLNGEQAAKDWLANSLRPLALRLFDQNTSSRLFNMGEKQREKVILSRKWLGSSLSGYGTLGANLFRILDLEQPKSKLKGDAA